MSKNHLGAETAQVLTAASMNGADGVTFPVERYRIAAERAVGAGMMKRDKAGIFTITPQGRIALRNWERNGGRRL